WGTRRVRRARVERALGIVANAPRAAGVRQHRDQGQAPCQQLWATHVAQAWERILAGLGKLVAHRAILGGRGCSVPFENPLPTRGTSAPTDADRSVNSPRSPAALSTAEK